MKRAIVGATLLVLPLLGAGLLATYIATSTYRVHRLRTMMDAPWRVFGASPALLAASALALASMAAGVALLLTRGRRAGEPKR